VVEPVDHVQHRGLAGAVRPDHREDLVTPDLDADPVERGDPAEGEGDPVGRQDRLADPFLRRHSGIHRVSAGLL
jgi:hypothetical protein